MGQSHLAQALAHEAARKGFDVLFTTAHALLTHLPGGRAAGSYEKRLGRQRCPDCGVFCRRAGPGGACPHCEEPVALAGSLGAGEGGAAWRRTPLPS